MATIALLLTLLYGITMAPLEIILSAILPTQEILTEMEYPTILILMTRTGGSLMTNTRAFIIPTVKNPIIISSYMATSSLSENYWSHQ